MKQSQKKYVIIGSLCAVVLMMIVGYAAFNSVLNINGTSSINSNWDVKITNIEKIDSKGSTDKEGTPKFDNLSATFNTDFTTPGDYATYKIEITNNGSMDATLKNITIPENTNNDILFYLNKNQNNEDIADTLKQNDTLFKKGETGNVGYVYVTVLYRDYENQQTAQTKSQTMTITFDFEQITGNINGEITSGYTGTLYSKNVLTNDDNANTNYIYLGDSVEKIKVYAKTDSSKLGNFYLKHIMQKGQVESNEVCFIKNNLEYCLKTNEYENSKEILLNLFGKSACRVSASTIGCDYDSLYIGADSDGVVASEGPVDCGAYGNGSAYCMEY